ncbi:MAG: hypothetical protein JRD68_15700 [Deltaproteobacteria bacterium]|nr:hypothetical protein [Deltaproteobacteria bacterium]
MKKILTVMAIIFALSIFAGSASAATVEGSVQGLLCVTLGKVCPVGFEDPMIAAENVFVILTVSGKYYFVPNLDRGIMARHLNEKVKVEGPMSSQFDAITADKLYTLRDDGFWNKVWDKKWMNIVIDDLGIPDSFPGKPQ